jgi:putative spermidine/putrescine transport system substrate-binding protein
MTKKTHNKGPMPTRRAVLAGAAAVGVIAGFPGIVRAQSKTIVTTLFGGIYEERYRKHVLAPFEEKHGVQFVIKYGSPSEWLTNAMVNRDEPEIDLPFLSLPIAMKAIKTEGLFIDLNPSDIPSLNDVDPIFYDLFERKAVAFNYVDNGLMYRTDTVNPAPTAWADMWDPRFKNQLMLPDVSGGFFHEMIVIAALIHGGSLDNLDPGFEALKKLKPNVFRFFKTPNEVPAIIQRGEASVASYAASRAFAIKDGGQPVDYVVPKEGAPIGTLSYHIPEKARNRDLLIEFVNWAMSVGPQTGFGNEMQVGMANRNVKLDAAVAARVAPHDKLLRIDWPKLEPMMTPMAERFQREITA